MQRKVLLCASVLAFASLCGYPGHAYDLDRAISSGSLDSEDTVAFLMLGAKDGVRSQLPDGAVVTVQAVGRELTSNDPYGHEIRFGNAGPSMIVSVHKSTGCLYTMDLHYYQVSRLVFPNEKPKLSRMELDFSKAVSASVVVADYRRTGQVVGLECTPVENAINECASIKKNGLLTFASGVDMLKAFAYFQEKFCPRKQ